MTNTVMEEKMVQRNTILQKEAYTLVTKGITHSPTKVTV